MTALTERSSRVVSAVKLHRGAHRRRTGTFLVEGANSVEAAIADARVREIFYTKGASDRILSIVDRAESRGVAVSSVTDRAAAALGDTVTPPGLVAVCDQVDIPLDEVLAAPPRLLAVPVEMSEPGNAGTLVRVADAVGSGGVVFAGDSVDPHNGKCVRSSAGSLFHLPIVRSRDVAATLDALSAAGIQLLATTADGDVDLDDADELLARPTAWLFGNEAHGLDPAVASRADYRVRIPIHGRAESLNLAAAGAICMYASSRIQRRKPIP